MGKIIDWFGKVVENSGWVGFLYYKTWLFWESFEMYKIEWDIQKKKMYRIKRDGGSMNFNRITEILTFVKYKKMI